MLQASQAAANISVRAAAPMLTLRSTLSHSLTCFSTKGL
jgi:hypothetical protein